VVRDFLNVADHMSHVVSAHCVLRARVHAHVRVQLEDAGHVVEEDAKFQAVLRVQSQQEGLYLRLQFREHGQVLILQLSQRAQGMVFENDEVACVAARMQVLAQHPLRVVNEDDLGRERLVPVDEMVYPLFVNVHTAVCNILLHVVAAIMLWRAYKKILHCWPGSNSYI